MQAAHSLPAEHFLQSVHCTAHPDCLSTAQPCTKKKAQYNYSVIRLLMSYIVFTMIPHMQFKLQVASQADYVVNYTFFFQFIEINCAYRATEINESFGMHGIKKNSIK
jgi:hypothetical protein